MRGDKGLGCKYSACCLGAFSPIGVGDVGLGEIGFGMGLRVTWRRGGDEGVKWTGIRMAWG